MSMNGVKKIKRMLFLKFKYFKLSVKERKIIISIRKNRGDEMKVENLKKLYLQNEKQKELCEIEMTQLRKFEFKTKDLEYKKYVLEGYKNAVGGYQSFVAYRDELDVNVTEEDIKLIAFYLPQFHQFEENDKWWGRGFTEWTNVTRAVPQFVGHYQPHLPIDLGFYNACTIETQQRQIELAKQYGIYGFCYYYYWFSSRRLMEKPVDLFLENRDKLKFPFCLCWANENWSRRWDGNDEDILIAQEYLLDDDTRFIEDIKKYLMDDRYIKINGKPLLIVYIPHKLPDAKKTFAIWRNHCKEVGIGEIYLAAAKTSVSVDYSEYGVDVLIEFPPHTIPCPKVNKSTNILNPSFAGSIWDLSNYVETCYEQIDELKTFKCVFPSWDNTARKPNNPSIFVGTGPKTYAKWLKKSIDYTKKHLDSKEQIIFINAWNEWAEGAHLEPDRKYGYAYLQETANAIVESRKERGE